MAVAQIPVTVDEEVRWHKTLKWEALAPWFWEGYQGSLGLANFPRVLTTFHVSYRFIDHSRAVKYLLGISHDHFLKEPEPMPEAEPKSGAKCDALMLCLLFWPVTIYSSYIHPYHPIETSHCHTAIILLQKWQVQLLPGRAHRALIIACRCRWVAPGHAWWLLKPGRHSFKPGWMTSLQWDMRLRIQHLCAVVRQKISCWKLRGMEFQIDSIFCYHQTWSDRIDLHVWRPLKVASIGSRDETWTECGQEPRNLEDIEIQGINLYRSSCVVGADPTVFHPTWGTCCPETTVGQRMHCDQNLLDFALQQHSRAWHV